MTADQQPQKCPITGAENCADRNCELHYMNAPIKLDPNDSAANAEFFRLLSREIDVEFPETEPIRIDRKGWEMLHLIVDGILAQNTARLAMLAALGMGDLEPDEVTAVQEFVEQLQQISDLHKAVSGVCKRISKSEDVNLVVVPF